MSLGALGQYGSDSSISDSGEEDCEEVSSKTVDASTACVDPLSLGASQSSSTSDSDSSYASPPAAPQDTATAPPALPLPDIDDVVTKNASYSASERYTSAITAGKESTDQLGRGQLEENKSSVFTNSYEQAEAAKLAMLKKHVSEFDKKPATRGPSPPPNSRKQYKKRKKPSFDSVKDKSTLFDDNDSSLSVKKERKHRCGVTDTLEPPKKYMKMYDTVYK